MTIEWAIQVLGQLKKAEYTGNITFNFFRGGVSGVNYFQSTKNDETKMVVVHVGDEVRMVAVG
jgi:hypothetical protein